MKIYLDTAHLQKWHQNTLCSKSINILNNLKNDGNHTFILSNTHIQEIVSPDPNGLNSNLKKKILSLLDFLDNLPKVWIRNPHNLHEIEIKNALTSYKNLPNTNNELSIFLPDFVDTLEPSSSITGDPYILENWLNLRGKKLIAIFKDALQYIELTIYDDNSNIASWGLKNNSVYSQLDKNQKKQAREQLYKKLLTDLINKLFPKLDTKEDFYKHLLANPQLIPSNYISFHLQHILHGNINQKLEPGCLRDIVHLNALPYVNYLTCDNRNYGQINNFIKKLNSKFKHGTLITDLQSLNKL